MSKSTKKIVTIYGNLGKDPVRHQTRQKEVEYNKFNPVTEGVDTHTAVKPSKTFLTFSIAVKNSAHPDTPTWVQCIDWQGDTGLFRQGDRVRLVGHFQLRTYTDREGVEQRVNQLVIEGAGLEKPKIRPSAREAQEQVQALPVEKTPYPSEEEESIPF